MRRTVCKYITESIMLDLFRVQLRVSIRFADRLCTFLAQDVCGKALMNRVRTCCPMSDSLRYSIKSAGCSLASVYKEGPLLHHLVSWGKACDRQVCVALTSLGWECAWEGRERQGPGDETQASGSP